MNSIRCIVLSKFDDIFRLFAHTYLLMTDCPLVVIDDGLSKGMKKRFPAFTYLPAPQPYAWNIGIRYVDPDDVILLNDDFLIHTRQFEKVLQGVAYADGKIGMAVACMTNVMNDHQRDIQLNEGWSFIHGDVNGVCYLRRELIKEVGLFDEEFAEFTIYGSADSDFSMRVRDAGYVHAMAHACFVEHGGPVFGHNIANTKIRLRVKAAEHRALNRTYWKQKWGNRKKVLS